jgi:hypothetical protein
VVGFELEFVSRPLDRRHGSPSELASRRIRLPFGTLGEDGGAYEIRTRPVSGSRAAPVLMSCLEFMASCSARTRPEDGLHVNVSFAKKGLHFMVNPISVWMLANPRRWALKFGRSRCWACRLPGKLAPAEVLDFLSTSSPAARPAINFSHFRPSSAPMKSRIEFRYPGGRDYHHRPRLLLSCLESILSATAGSLVPMPLRHRIALKGVSSAQVNAPKKTSKKGG